MRTAILRLAILGLVVTLAACTEIAPPAASTGGTTQSTSASPAPQQPAAGGATDASSSAQATTPSSSAAQPAASAAAGSTEGTVAASVDGTDISMDDFRRQAIDTQRFYVEKGLDPNSPSSQQELLRLRRQVLDDMINQVIIEQAAKQMGITATDAEVSDNVQKSIDTLGGQDKFDAALQQAGSTMDDVKSMERSSIIGRKVQEKVTTGLPATAEAVHARHILCADEATCQQALTRLQNGEDFATVAKAVSTDKVSADRGGDLDWVVRGQLPSRQVEDAIFALAAGQRSAVVKTDFGYHVIEVIEKDPSRTLSEDQLNTLRQAKLAAWLKDQRSKATITIYVEDLKDVPAQN